MGLYDKWLNNQVYSQLVAPTWGSSESAIKLYIPEVKKLIFHDPATIVYWKDGSKTVVKCMDGTPFNEYYGFVCALAKKIYGSNSAIDREIKKGERG